MVVAGPRSAGGVQERKAQTISLLGVTSMAWTGGLAGSTLPDHWLNQLLMMVLWIWEWRDWLLEKCSGRYGKWKDDCRLNL